MSDHPIELFLEIDEHGAVRPTSRAMQRRLAAAAGRFRLVPSIDGLVVLQRVDEHGAARSAGHLALCGEVDGAGDLANMLNFIHFSQWGGTLTIMAHATRRALFFQHGRILGAASNLPEHLLGALLVRLGLVGEADLAACVREVTPKRRLGNVLVDRGLISVHHLYEGVRRQAEEIFYSALLVPRGAFTFVKHLDETAVPTRLHLDTQALLLEGLRRFDEMTLFRSKLPSPDVILVRRNPAPSTHVEADGAAVLAAVNDRRSVAEIARACQLGEFQATKAAYALVQSGHVAVKKPPELKRRKPVPEASLPTGADVAIIDAYNDALAGLLGAMAAKGKASLLRQAADAFFAGSARFGDLFRSIVMGEDGALPRHQVLANIDGLPAGERLALLQRGLNELLFFLLFVAGDAIERQEEHELHARVAGALSRLETPAVEGDLDAPE